MVAQKKRHSYWGPTLEPGLGRVPEGERLVARHSLKKGHGPILLLAPKQGAVGVGCKVCWAIREVYLYCTNLQEQFPQGLRHETSSESLKGCGLL